MTVFKCNRCGEPVETWALPADYRDPKVCYACLRGAQTFGSGKKEKAA